MDPRLKAAIGTPRIQTQACELVRLALLALADLRRLDESLYERFVATREAPEDAGASAQGLERLWEHTFRGVLLLLAYARRLAGDRAAESGVPLGRQRAGTASDLEVEIEVEGQDDFDLDFGEAPAAASPGDGLDLEGVDIGGLLEEISERPREQTDAQKWSTVLETLGSIEYGLRSQYGSAVARLTVALQAGNLGEVLALLDDTQSSTSEGVHAVVTAVYEAFVPGVDPTTLVPGYMTSLGRALLVRRGLTELAAELEPYNAMLQAPDATRHGPALDELRAVMAAFVDGEVCRSMRAADRWQLVQFARDLRDQPLAAARMTSEGLVKYLESLGSVNQREVLLRHDQRQLDQVRDALATARQLIDLSVPTALEMLDAAYKAAVQLRGRAAGTDAMIIALAELVPTAPERAPAARFLERLEQLLAASGG